MANLQPLRGTRDLLPQESRKHRHIADTARTLAALYGFEEIETPIIESTAVFARNLGDTSDIVTKQMYTFQDRGGDEITLRPEGTAGVARAFISEGLSQNLPLKLFYCGPMFRYERPQKGRYRQFSQFGVELLGPESPQADIEVIALCFRLLKELRVADSIEVQINTIGDSESRVAYAQALVSYLTQFRAQLSADSQMRLEKNPLRILDSKDPADHAILANAPRFPDFLNASSKQYFQNVLEGLQTLGIPFRVEDKLVRGLDYYCHTVCEFIAIQGLGSQSAVCAGGRYDELIRQMGGPRTPGVGWGFGIDRLALMLPELPPAIRPVAIVPVADEWQNEGLRLCEELRSAGFSVDMAYSGNMGKRFKRADKIGAFAAIVLGDEFRRGHLVLKNLSTGEQKEIPCDALQETLAQLRPL